MKFTFKTLLYQTEAVDSIVRVFEGQEFSGGIRHRHDIGTRSDSQAKFDEESGIPLTDVDLAYRNNDFSISKDDVLKNIQNVQKGFGLPVSDKIVDPLGMVTLDVEMETGTGKTYVYTKTMFELNRRYGWNKFIIVVPSIAIREGVYKSIQTTESHFMEQYGKKLRAFIYSSSDLYKIDEFSQSSGINVMIINSQAFAASFKEGGKNEQSRIIYSSRDEFQSRRPIDIIAANRPILILDEPQKLGKDDSKTQNALRNNFNALFSMNFSATHTTHHNQIYSLDALDAYNQKLVKKIRVKGIKINHLSGSERYIYLEGIDPGKNYPTARMEIFVNHASGIRSEMHVFRQQDNLYEASNHIESYKRLFITEIDGISNTVTFSDGTVLMAGEATGDITESGKRRIQIRETILSHLDQESKLFSKGIKVLSLFFIDEVAKYRQYDNLGMERLGEYGQIFEDEFKAIIASRGSFYDPEYIASLTRTDVSAIHSGYFSIDKKGRAVDSEVKRGQDGSQDVSAYDLILKNKELLLSQRNPVRFIFSHSALSEGWDNPNVFQICVLKHSDSTTRRRQEVGRGMRICVDQKGDRQDFDILGPLFHDYNALTVVADEDYESFVKGLQDETVLDIRHRSISLTPDFLENKAIIAEEGEIFIESREAKILHRYLSDNWYIDYDGLPTSKLKDDLHADSLKPLPAEIEKLSPGLLNFLRKVAEPQTIRDITENGRKPRIKSNSLNRNFQRKEFVELWNEINHMYHYKVAFDSEELIRKSIVNINERLTVSGISYTITTGSQKTSVSYEDALERNGFDRSRTEDGLLDASSYVGVKYDLIGKIASKTGLTRRTIASILKGINNSKIDMFKVNPEEFIEKTSKLINEEKSTIIVDHIEYNMTDERFDNNIFTMNRPECDFDKAYQAKKNIQDYVFTDSQIERRFAENLDGAEEVVVYSKLPDGKGGFFIPTPMGEYTPDWAIAFDKGDVRHIFFVAETKGSMSTMDLSKIEENKIKCAKRLFDNSDIKVSFGTVDSYSHLLDLVRGV